MSPIGKPVVLRFITSGEKQVEASFERIAHKTGALGGKFGKFGAIASKALVGVMATGAGLGLMSVKLADKYETAHARLETSLKSAGTSWEKEHAAIGKASKAGEKFGFTMTDTEEALANLTRSTGSSKKALSLLGVSQDLAAAKGIGLADAASLVAKASLGQIKPLKALGIDLPVAAGGALKLQKANEALTKATAKYKDVQSKIASGELKGKAAKAALAKANQGLWDAQHKVNLVSKAGTAIIVGLSAKLKGSATAAAETFGGKVKALKAGASDLGIKFGMFLIPILIKLTDAIQTSAKWLGDHKGVMIAAGIVVGTITAALIAYKIAVTAVSVYTKIVTVATKLWTAAQWLFNAAMNANPVSLVVIAIVALGAAIYVAYQKFGPFHRAVDAMWQILQSGYAWVKSNWPLLLAILTGPIGLAVLAITRHWSTIKDGFTGVKDWIGTKIGQIVGFFTGLPGRIGRGVAGMFNGIKDSFKSAINWVIKKWNDLEFTIGGQKVFGHKLPSVTIGTPNIPYLANGALVSRPTLAMIGDDGPEAVLPLSRPSRARELIAQTGIMGRATQRDSGRAGHHIVQHITALNVHEAMRIAAAEAAWAAKTSGN